MKRTVAFMLFCGLLLWAAGASEAGKSEPKIDAVAPPNPAEGTLLTLSGSGFGQHAYGRVVAFIVPGVPLDRERDDGRGRPLKPVLPHHGTPFPIVEWRPDSIQVWLTSAQPGQHDLAIWDGPKARVSNEVTVTVRAVPPARAAREAGKPYVWLVHPELASPGQELDLYGDFPAPDRSIYKAAVSPLGAPPKVTVPQMLRPLELSGNHARVRLPEKGLPPGEYYVTVVKDLFRSNVKRVIIRSTTPAAWENTSSLPGGDTVEWKLVAAIRNVGAEGRQLDVLGVHFGPNQTTPDGFKRAVVLMTAPQLKARKAHYIDAHVPIPDELLLSLPLPEVVSWSDTRIRVEPQGLIEKGAVYVVVQDARTKASASNVVRITPIALP